MSDAPPRGLDEIVAETVRAHYAPKWQPIETAPRVHWSPIMIWDGAHVGIGRWHERGFWVSGNHACPPAPVPTHWQPLPDPPP